MSNQRVVVLTDDEIRETIRRLESYGDTLFNTSTCDKLVAALGHSGGITDERARLAGEWLYRWRWPSDQGLEQYGGRWTESGREMLEAALFPGNTHNASHRVETSTSGMSSRCLDCDWTYEYD